MLRLCLYIDCFFYSFMTINSQFSASTAAASCVTVPHEFKIMKFERFFIWNFLISVQYGWMQTSSSGLYVPFNLACSGQKCGLCCKGYGFLFITFTSKFVLWISEDVKTLVARHIQHTLSLLHILSITWCSLKIKAGFTDNLWTHITHVHAYIHIKIRNMHKYPAVVKWKFINVTEFVICS
jgi:hypothetical protein